ncbi:hypothetical protein E5K00_14750 [Hymenobacter aquaticus]|uniref:Uncharacterized protein n=1 Tax=Hymenobacter aquaticus TaxID=1867101 RepID=A0A4Z0PUS6_9BACT|nr:hypothetical protein [Hymenobacter aquaticus]TGE21540.1 hypothetical protein E5K00_14750 [Hymenobacter aquaticus]
MDYIQWNNLVADYLFKPDRQGQEVFLYLTEDNLLQAVQSAAAKPTATSTLVTLAKAESAVILRDFWQALQRGPVFWDSVSSGKQSVVLSEELQDCVVRDAPAHPAELAKYAWQDWMHAAQGAITGQRTVMFRGNRKLSLKAPLHLLYLACFTLPFSIDTSVTRGFYRCWNNFFRGKGLLLRQTEMPDNAFAQLGSGVWVQMWQELARWSQEDLQGARGVLVARKLGHHIHVGWPRAQCLLPPTTLSGLPAFFGRNNLLPGSKVTADKMRTLLLQDPSILLPASTRHELQESTELGVAVVDIVQNVLDRWTGSTSRRERVIRLGGQVKTVEYRGETYARLMPFIPDWIGETGKLTLHYRLDIKTPIPDDMKLTGPGIQQQAVQPETAEWSQEVEGIVTSSQAQVYRDPANNWKVVAQLAELQVFISGGRYGFYQWWVPAQTLEHGTPLLILCHKHHASAVQQWKNNVGPAGFLEWSHFDGVPNDYCLFWLEGLPVNATGLAGLPVATETQIVAEGGLACGYRTYLDELVPSFRVINGQRDWQLCLAYTDGGPAVELCRDEKDAALWHLPSDMVTDRKFKVFAVGEANVSSLPHCIVSSKLPENYSAPSRDSLGLATTIIPEELAGLCYDGYGLRGETQTLKQLRLRQQVVYAQYFQPVC